MSKSPKIIENCKKYNCNICNVESKQKSHHKKHIQSEKHKDKRALCHIEIEKLSKKSRQKSFHTIEIEEILDILEGSEIMQYKETNKESLKEKIHEIHNFLRNNGVGYGMNALKVFNVIYGLKKIEESRLIEKVSLCPECKFKHLLKLANEYEDEKLVELIKGKVLQSIHASGLRDFLFYEIPENIPGRVFRYLIKEINKITKLEQSCNVLLSGKIYEYFIGRDESAISELGAYFTNRHITNFIFNKLKPSVNADGTISSIIDPFGGSGGFTVGYIQYLNEHHQNIDWDTEINKIHHYDMNNDVIKSAGLEIFCLTGVIPNMNNLKSSNSFKNEFGGKKYKYVPTNPPYGGDKHKKTAAQKKREKILKYIKQELSNITDESVKARREKQLNRHKEIDKQEKKEKKEKGVSVSTCSKRIQKFAKKYSLTGNDKESCSLMLFMDMVEMGGTVIAVLKEGVFFNKKYKNLRKCLIEHFNVREIISIPPDAFENTATKTSIIIFDNTEEKTSQVKFSDLVVEKYEDDKFAEVNGNIILTENKADVKNVYGKAVSSASKDEILENDIYSLNGEVYKKNEIVVGDDYKLVRFGDICKFLQKSNRSASFGKKSGKYNFYTSSEKVKKCDIADYDQQSLIIGDGGQANIKIDKIFSCSDHNHIITCRNGNENLYIYWLLYGTIELLSNGFSGSVLKNLSKKYLENLQLPLPKSQAKMQEWVDKISVPYNEKIQKQTRIKELESFVQNRIRDIGENEECDEVKLGDICNILCGKNLPKKKAITGKYNVYGGGKSSYTHNEFNCEGFHTIISRVGNNNVTLLNETFYLTDNGFSLIITDSSIKQYFGYYILNNNKMINNIGNGSAQKVISKTQLKKIKIKIPQNKQLIKDLEPQFEEIERLQVEVKNTDKLYKQYIQELSQEAIVK